MRGSRILDILYKAEILLLVTLPPAGVGLAVYYLWNRYVFVSDIILFAVMFTIAMFGATIGYHRYLTHRGFECGNVLKALLVIAGITAFEGRPLDWVPTHIKHHAHSDDDDDPHSPLHGFVHAHMGWIFDRHSFAKAEEYAPHLLTDPVILWVDRLYLLWMALSLAIPFLIGGWTGLVWAGGVRIFLNTHITYSVNSICHTFGRRAYETTDESRNNWIVGLLAFGEGWHNNHHAFPRNAFHGMRWWQVDLSGLLIRALESAGLVWNVQRVERHTAQAHQSRAAAAQQALLHMRDDLIAAVAKAKNDLGAQSASIISVSLTDTQKAQWKAFQTEMYRGFEGIQARLERTQHMKRRTLLALQTDLQGKLAAIKTQWSMTPSNPVS